MRQPAARLLRSLPARLRLGAVAALLAAPCAAQTLNFGGLATVVAGRTAGNCTASAARGAEQAANCTRFVADWAHAGLYTDRASLRPDSHAGVGSAQGMEPDPGTGTPGRTLTPHGCTPLGRMPRNAGIGHAAEGT